MPKERSPQKPRKTPAPKVRAPRLSAGRWTVIALVAVYAVGFWARFENYPGWLENRAEFFYNDQPILASGDGYWYLRLARDLAEDNYEAVDLQRRFPDAPLRPSPPPLLSSVTSVLHKVLGVSLERIAVFLPVLLAPLLLLIVYLLARATGGTRAMGLSAALLTVVSEYYVGRTRVGVYDTDCLIVTLTLAICYSVYRFAREKTLARYAFAAAAVAGYGVFYWWWDTGTTVVSAICLPMFAVALAFFYRPSRSEGLAFAAAALVVVVAALAWRGFDAPLNFARGVFATLAFVGGEEVAGPFPSGVGNIRELQVLPFAQMSRLVAGHAIIWFVAGAGALWWLWTARKTALLLAVPVLLALLPVFFGNRFLIFQVPVIALGFGYAVDRLWELRRRWGAMALLAPVATLAVAALCYGQAAANLYRSPMARSMKAGERNGVVDVLARLPHPLLCAPLRRHRREHTRGPAPRLPESADRRRQPQARG
jgi:asparagine N-glycosylation enzyme membrane subunit Stt3